MKTNKIYKIELIILLMNDSLLDLPLKQTKQYKQ